MSNVVKFTDNQNRPAINEGIIADTLICADWAFGGVTELLRRMNDDELEAIGSKAYGVLEEAPDDVINPANEALITLIECEMERRDWWPDPDGDVA
ncbi:hypothetical protein WMC41_16030 [Shinella yambaruensis]|uniref:hypothetical protein n=1 Tax=Shinella yambaruensis TaxID=415996 RepID=UPI003D78CE56